MSIRFVKDALNEIMYKGQAHTSIDTHHFSVSFMHEIV